MQRQRSPAPRPRAQPAEPFTRRLTRHLRDLATLAWPVMLSRAGILVMAFVDIAMLGRYSAAAIAEANLGLAIFVPLMVASIGLVSGVVPVVSQAFGAGRWRDCGEAWRRALAWAALVSGMASLVCWQGERLLLLFGQTPELAAAGGAVARVLTPGLVAQALFAASSFYLESTRRPLPGLVAMVIGNIVNIGLNWLLIWGHWGLPELGARGAMLATTLVRVGLALGLALYILSARDALAAGLRGRAGSIWGPGGWRAGREMRRLGLAAGLAGTFETVAFAAMTLFAGQLGTLPLAAYSLSHNLVSMTFMFGLGLAIATGVRVGIEFGAGRPAEARFAGWSGVLAVVVVMGGLGLLVGLNREAVASVYTDDPVVAARVVALFALAALVFVPDGAQVVLGQALRALGDAWVTVACYVVAFLITMVPLGWLMVHRLGWDERGLVLAIIVGCVAATVLLGLRFHMLTARLVAARGRADGLPDEALSEPPGPLR